METSSFFQSLYKKQNKNVAKLEIIKNVQKKGFQRDHRNRHQAHIDLRRNLADVVISPIPSTMKKNNNSKVENKRNSLVARRKMSKAEERVMKLEQWKLAKEQRKEKQKIEQKPVFKVCSSARLPSLSSMYNLENYAFTFNVPPKMKLVPPKKKQPKVVEASTRVTRSRAAKTNNEQMDNKSKMPQNIFKTTSIINNKSKKYSASTSASLREKSVQFTSNRNILSTLENSLESEDENDHLFNRQAAGRTPKIRGKKPLIADMPGWFRNNASTSPAESTGSPYRKNKLSPLQSCSPVASKLSRKSFRNIDTDSVDGDILLPETNTKNKVLKVLSNAENKNVLVPDENDNPLGEELSLKTRRKSSRRKIADTIGTENLTETKENKLRTPRKSKSSTSRRKIADTNDTENPIETKENELRIPSKSKHSTPTILRTPNRSSSGLSSPGLVKPTSANGRKSLRKRVANSPLLLNNSRASIIEDTITPGKETRRLVKGNATNSSNAIVIENDETPSTSLSKAPHQSSTTHQNSSSKVIMTPQSPKLDSLGNYFSPSVVRSRGKAKAHQEWRERREAELAKTSSSPLDANEIAGAAYFRKLLSDQIGRLQKKCTLWEMFKNNGNDVSEGAIEMIDTAIGQTNLLITKKFKQFEDLIDGFEFRTATKRILCEDLHGFWDMVYMQVENLDKRFDNLEQMKNNNWEEILPKGPPKRTVRQKNARPAAKQGAAKSAASGIRAHIAAMKKKQQSERTPRKSIQISEKTPRKSVQISEKTPRKSVQISEKTPRKTPSIQISEKTPRKSAVKVDQLTVTPRDSMLLSDKTPRKSILKSVLKSEARKRISSPGLIMARVTTSAKGLSSPNTKAKAKPTKTVLFKDNNDLMSFSSPESPPVRQKRRSRKRNPDVL